MRTLIRPWPLVAAAMLVGTRLAAAQSEGQGPERWQVTLDDGRYVWDVRLVQLSGDTLIVRQSDSLVHILVAHIDELRLFQKTILRVGDEHESAINALARGNDRVYDLAGLDLAQRRRAIERILRDGPGGHE